VSSVALPVAPSSAGRIFVVALVSTMMVLPGVQWLMNSASAISVAELPDGQLIYLLSKLAGLYAIAFASVQIAYGLAGAHGRRTLDLDFGVGLHRALGLTVLGLAFAHAALFVWCVSVRTQHFASHYAFPIFGEGYYVERISLGWYALVAIAVAVVVALLRTRIGNAWRIIHWLAVPAGVAIAVHSLSIGTETRMPLMQIAYSAMAMLLALGAFLRFRGKGTTLRSGSP
jgi:hypothetical protein